MGTRPAKRGRFNYQPSPRKGDFKGYDAEELEFMRAMDLYKREKNRPFPAWSEVLEVLRELGYRKVANAGTDPTGKISIDDPGGDDRNG